MASTWPIGPLWQIVRSSDADMGGHLIDPTGTGKMTEDGRWAWAAELECAVLANAVVNDDFERPLRTGELPEWADRLALRGFRADTWTSLGHLREGVGDATIAPGAHYVRAETGGNGPAPVALGRGDDPEHRGDLDWRMDGEPVGLFVLDRDSEIRFAGGRRGPGRHVRVRTVHEHLERWLREQDPSMEGPSRGLRRPVPVHSAPALVHVVGKAGEVLSADKADPEVLFSGELQLAYGSPGVHELRRLARLLGRRELGRRTGQSAKVFERFLAGGSTSPEVLAAVSAVASSDPSVGEPLPRCARPGCSMPARERSRWCSEACKKAAQRARRSEGSAADDIDQDALARLPQCPRCATFLLGATSRHLCEGASS